MLNYTLPILFALFIFSFSGCGAEPLDLDTHVPQNQQAIINGELCDADTFPSAVALITDAEISVPFFGNQTIKQATCTGTLIAPDVVLTAAHCLDPTLATFGFGEVQSLAFYVSPQADLTSLEVQGATIPDTAQIASDWVAHPQFDLDNLQSSGGPINLKDVALVFLDSPLDIEPAIVITSTESEQIEVEADVSIVGWGMQTAEGGSPWERPPEGSTGKKVCAESFINEVGSHEFQVGGDSSTSRKCHGDSGGPTYMKVSTDSPKKWRVIGITSHAYDESDCEKGGIDTRVDAWLEWIEEEMIAACEAGARTDCDTPGILSPPPKEEDFILNNLPWFPKGTDFNLRAQSEDAAEESCGCRQTKKQPSKALWALGLLPWFYFRRRGRT